MNGAFIASDSNGAPCHRCGNRIRTGHRVYYTGSLLDDTGRTCADCVDLDLFGGAA
jgi:hypothetical protein